MKTKLNKKTNIETKYIFKTILITSNVCWDWIVSHNYPLHPKVHHASPRATTMTKR